MGQGQKINEQINRLSQNGRANAVTVALSLGFLIAAVSFPKFAAHGQNYAQAPSTPTPTSMPVVNIPIHIPVIVRPPVVVPVDVTNPQITNPTVTKVGPRLTTAQANTLNQATQTKFALAGINTINIHQFPGIDKVGKNFDWITVMAKEGAIYIKPNNYTAELKSGDIIVSVKEPSKLAFVKTAFGDIAIGANSDVMICYNNGVLRVLNFDGEGRVLKLNLNKGPFAGPADPTVTVAPGYELVASDQKITRAEMRPHDGIARRFGKVLENGHMAINEFSLESAQHSVGMLVSLQQNTTGIKERRIMTDLSKMAAVLNYRNGGAQGESQGYRSEK
jgi:hypothetical protein